MSGLRPGTSFVVPVHNGAAWLREVLHAIRAQRPGPIEIVAVDDGSTDGSREILAEAAAAADVVVLRLATGGGAAAAINAGIRASRYPVVCQVDQDVVLAPGWLAEVRAALAGDGVGAAQGWYATPRDASVWARVMGLDLEERYARIRGDELDQACTGNVAWKRAALDAVGLLDERLGYGYDNDLSYRMVAGGFRLRFCRAARARHAWRETLGGYLRQQYGVGYGRLDLVEKHPQRLAGDRVSGLRMILHVPIALAAAAALATASALALRGEGGAAAWGIAGAALGGALVVERGVAALAALRRFRDPAALLFPVVHLLRDGAWIAALAVWCGRRLTRRAPQPHHSMGP